MVKGPLGLVLVADPELEGEGTGSLLLVVGLARVGKWMLPIGEG